MFYRGMAFPDADRTVLSRRGERESSMGQTLSRKNRRRRDEETARRTKAARAPLSVNPGGAEPSGTESPASRRNRSWISCPVSRRSSESFVMWESQWLTCSQRIPIMPQVIRRDWVKCMMVIGNPPIPSLPRGSRTFPWLVESDPGSAFCLGSVIGQQPACHGHAVCTVPESTEGVT